MYTFMSNGKKGQHKCELIAEYLNETFTMCKQYPLTVHDYGNTGHYWENHWCIVMEKEDGKQYSNDIDKMKLAGRDFHNGYRKCLKDKQG